MSNGKLSCKIVDDCGWKYLSRHL